MTILDHRLLQAHGFAVMDPCVVEPSYWPDLPAASLAPPQLASRSHLLPSLLDLRSLSSEQIGDVLDAAQRWDGANAVPFLSALVSATGDIEAVAGRLRDRFTIKRPSTSETAVLRWHDPQVFEHLMRIFSSAWIEYLLQPIASWTWRNRRGVWTTTSAAGEVYERKRMDQALWRQLGRIGLLNRILGEAKPIADRRFAGDDAETASILLDQAIDLHGLSHEADCRLYVLQALKYGESIHSHPDLLTCLRQAQAGRATYVGACSQVSVEALVAWSQTNFHPRTEEHHGV